MDFTCVLKQGGSTPAVTVSSATYQVRDGECRAQFFLTANGAGSAGAEVKVTPTSLPANLTPGHLCRGIFVYNDAGAAIYFGAIYWDNTDLKLRVHSSASALGTTPSFTVASTDTLSATFIFPVA